MLISNCLLCRSIINYIKDLYINKDPIINSKNGALDGQRPSNRAKLRHSNIRLRLMGFGAILVA